MSSNDDHTPGSNVIDFGRRTGLTGFNLTPVPPSQSADTLGPVIPPQPATPPSSGTGERERRSPLDLIGALPYPALTMLPVPATTSPEPGLPATFRNGDAGEQPVGPRLGALSMAAVLAVAVAALRGSAIFLEDRRQRAMEKRAESAPMREAQLKHQLAMAQHGWDVDEAVAKGRTDVQKAREKAAEKNAKNNKVPSGTEFGRKTLGSGRSGGSPTGSKSGGLGTGSGRSGGKSGLGGGSGRGGSKSGSGGLGSGGGSKSSRSTGSGSSLGGGAKKNRTSTGSGTSGLGLGGGSKSKKTPTGNGSSGSTSSKKNRGSGSGSGLGLGGGKSKKNGKTNGTGTGSGGAKDKGGKKSPHRTSQGAGHSLGKSGTTGSSHTGTGGRNRKERAAARQDGRLNRKAARQDARLGERGKDKAAARDLKTAPKQARQDRRNRVRDARADAKEARREKVRQGKFDAKQNQRAAKADAKRVKKDEARLAKEKAAKTDDGRTKLWDAFKNDTSDTLGDRWGKRGTRVPPLWKNDKKREKKASKPKDETTGPGRKDKWRKARDRARDARDGFDTAKGDTSTGTTPPPTGGTAGASTSTGGTRRSPFGNAAASGATTWTVERDDQPTAHDTDGPVAGLTRGVAALDAAPEPHTKRPGTTRPKEPHAMPPAPVPVEKDPRIKDVRAQAVNRARAVVKQARRMDAQHETEITLDDACDEYEHFKDDAFKTNRQARKLAERSRKLAVTLEAFAEELAVSNNIIGKLFTGAMANLSEDMELLAAAADETETTSLTAAERSEANSDDLDDAYRPITDATADAGLTTPSAPVHNQT